MATLNQVLHRKNDSGGYDDVYLRANLANVTGTLAVANGGTGATTAAAARTNLGITPANIGAATSGHTHSTYATTTELNNLKTSVSNGKRAVASAITDKGVSTSATASYDTMASNIRSIASGKSPFNSSFDKGIIDCTTIRNVWCNGISFTVTSNIEDIATLSHFHSQLLYRTGSSNPYLSYTYVDMDIVIDLNALYTNILEGETGSLTIDTSNNAASCTINFIYYALYVYNSGNYVPGDVRKTTINDNKRYTFNVSLETYTGDVNNTKSILKLDPVGGDTISIKPVTSSEIKEPTIYYYVE